MGCSENSSKREVYSYTSLPQETRKISNQQSNLTPKGTRERRTNKTQSLWRKEIIKIRGEINKIETKTTIAKISKTKSLFFEEINKIDKPLAKLIKKKIEKTQINTIRNEKGNIATNATEIKRNVREYYEKLYANKLDNQEAMEKFLETHNLSRLNHEELEILHKSTTSKEIKSVIKDLLTKKS